MLQPLGRANPDLRARPAATTSLCVRDQQTLGYLAGFRALSARQLAELVLRADPLAPASRPRVIGFVLRRLRARGLLGTAGALPDAPLEAPVYPAYLLTPRGRRAYAGLDGRFPVTRLRAPRLSSLAHALLLADIALAIRDALEDLKEARMTWECDWETVARVGSTLVIPDALLTYDLDHRRVFAFVEADRATEAGPAFARKVGRYLALYRSDIWRTSLPVWPLVLTITTTRQHAVHLSRCTDATVRRLGEAHLVSRFRFTTFAELRGPLGPLGTIWRVAGRTGVHPVIDGALDVGADARETPHDG